MGEHTLEFTDDNFKSDVLESPIPVLVDFWAPWCGPCRQLTPIIEQLAVEYDGRVKVGKVNVDNSMEVAGQFNIRGVPTLLLFKGGQLVNQQVGASPKETIVKMIEAVL